MTSLVFDIEVVENKSVFDNYRREYTSVERLAYNYISDREPKDRLSTYDYQKASSEIKNYLNNKNNVDLITSNSYLLNCLISNANSKVNSLEELKNYDQKQREKLVKSIDILNEKISKLTSTKKKSVEKKKKLKEKVSKKQAQITHIDNKKYMCVDGTTSLMRRYTKQQWNKQHNKEINGEIISKDMLTEARLHPIHIIGESAHHGNRFCYIEKEEVVDEETGEITEVFYFDLCFDRQKKSNSTHIILKIKNKLKQNHIKMLETFYNLDKNTNSIPVALTYNITSDKLTITYNEKELYKNEYSHIQRIPNRVMAIDNNPNYLGWSIVDWYSSSDYKIIQSGVYSLKEINDEWFALNRLGNVSSDDERRIDNHNKREHEIFEISHNLIHKANYYKCSLFGIEDLNIVSTDRILGQNLNALCNNLWMRNDMFNNIHKLCNIFNIRCLDIDASYSSIYGNIIFRKEGLSDPINASLEIGRRTYEFYNQYIIKTKDKIRNIIKPVGSDFKKSIAEALEAFRLHNNKNANKQTMFAKFMTDTTDLYELYLVLKETGTPYRVPIKHNDVSRFLSPKSKVKIIH